MNGLPNTNLSNDDKNVHVSPNYPQPHVTVRFVNRARTQMRICHIYVGGSGEYLEHEIFPWRAFDSGVVS